MYFTINGILVKDIDAGGRHVVAYSESHGTFGWGFNFYYQLGQSYGNKEDHFSPIKIEVGNLSD
jgi:hypothetical protein